MRFGAFVPQGWRLDLVGEAHPYQAMKATALRLEALGYESLWLYDHLHTVPDAVPEACFEVWTATAALAEATSRIRLGQMCGCNMYRPPSLLAKITANIDVISGGRLEVGIGAGWYQHEAVAYGYPFEKPATRIGQLDEAVQILKGMWTHEHFQFEGRHYTVGKGDVRNYRGQPESLRGALNDPKPIQKPHPPLWIAGGGEQLTLRTVARYADWSNFMGPLPTVIHKNEMLDRHCEKEGRDPAAIGRSVNINVMLAEEAEIDSLLRASGRNDVDIKAMKDMLFPTEPQALIDRLAGLKEEGRITYAIVYFPDILKGHSAERFMKEVVPALR